MSEFQNKNDYSCIVFNSAGFLCKYTFVGNVYKFSKFLDAHDKFNTWETINVYARRSGNFIIQLKKGGFIPPKPRY